MQLKNGGNKKRKSITTLTRNLDKVFSEYIRRRSADWRGYARCVSCGVRKPWKEIQCGHYVKRSARATRWDIRNCFPQCVGCNIFQKGNYPNFTKYLLDNYGEQFVKELVIKGNKIQKLTPLDLEEQIIFFKEQLKNL